MASPTRFPYFQPSSIATFFQGLNHSTMSMVSNAIIILKCFSQALLCCSPVNPKETAKIDYPDAKESLSDPKRLKKWANRIEIRGIPRVSNTMERSMPGQLNHCIAPQDHWQRIRTKTYLNESKRNWNEDLELSIRSLLMPLYSILQEQFSWIFTMSGSQAVGIYLDLMW